MKKKGYHREAEEEGEFLSRSISSDEVTPGGRHIKKFKEDIFIDDAEDELDIRSKGKLQSNKKAKREGRQSARNQVNHFKSTEPAVGLGHPHMKSFDRQDIKKPGGNNFTSVNSAKRGNKSNKS